MVRRKLDGLKRTARRRTPQPPATPHRRLPIMKAVIRSLDAAHDRHRLQPATDHRASGVCGPSVDLIGGSVRSSSRWVSEVPEEWSSSSAAATGVPTHASEIEYARFIAECQFPKTAQKQLLRTRRVFVERYPDLHVWSQAPLPERIGRISGETGGRWRCRSRVTRSPIRLAPISRFSRYVAHCNSTGNGC